MGGPVAIVIFLLVLPVLILIGAAVGAAIFGTLLSRDVEITHAGSELVDLNV